VKIESLPYTPVTVEDASLTLTCAPTEPPRWRRAPADPADRELSPAAFRWLAKLPEGVRPARLPVQFPRIANRLAALWRSPARCEPYLQSLLIIDRPGRQGFPAEVALELGSLTSYYQTVLHPRPNSVWDTNFRN
jgi:hypothetical protein